MLETATKSTTEVFTEKLASYKDLIDQDIATYTRRLQHDTLQRYGAAARLEIDAYLHILARGGKRIRGALAMAGYEMCGGRDMNMITSAARALEMLHAYILIVDDIQDRSAVRRGGATAHVELAQYHRDQELAGDSAHFGVAIALNSALAGAHAAHSVLADLQVKDSYKLAAINAINETMVTTAHGQTNDILNEVVADVTSDEIERVLEWKTAHYTFLNPLRVGMILTGANEHTIDAIKPYAMNAGMAFQITDDVLGTFGTEFESGKSPMDDIREGKRTVITEYALTHSNDDNKNFLIRMLGNTQLTPAEFERCKDILVQSGALQNAQEKAAMHIRASVDSLAAGKDLWSGQGISFLTGLAKHLVGRTN